MAARRYEHLDEDYPDLEESDPPDRGPSLSASPPATPTSPPAAAAPGPVSPPGRPSQGHEPNDVVGRRVRAAISHAAMPTEDLRIVCELAGGESRLSGLPIPYGV